MLIGKRTVKQVAALPFVLVTGNIEVMLITSRGRRRLILPKGWPEKQMTGAEAARKEANDEAGVDGDIASDPIGFYQYDKSMSGGYSVPCSVAVYPMRVTFQALEWREADERTVGWYTLDEAAQSVSDPDLKRLLAEVAGDGAESLIRKTEIRTG